MATDKIKQALHKQFQKTRILIWYDRNRELRDEFDALQFDDVQKIVIENNEFGVKLRILREEPEQKFLLYHPGPQPEDHKNWLLDVLLAYGEFRTDQVSIWLSELDLGPEYAQVVSAHEEFFRSKRRMELLQRSVTNQDSHDAMRLKMLSVCVGTDPRLDSVLEGLFAELATDKDDAEKLIVRCGLDAFLWRRVKEDYGYSSLTPGAKDFAITLFKSCYEFGTGGNSSLRSEALVLFTRWKDSRQHSDAFETLSERYADLLRIQYDLENRDYHSVVDIDYFRLIDRKVISGLVSEVDARTISARDVQDVIRSRRKGYWYDEFDHLYKAIEYAALFIETLDTTELTMSSLADGVERYTRLWYKIDQLYRQFMFHLRKSSQHTLMQQLADRVENQYTNNYLLPLNDNWQAYVDEVQSWHILGVASQADFFHDHIESLISKPNKKIYVIISDALRYEVASELATLIRREDRYDADIDPMLSVLPSYTQLGMAALLPHQELSITSDSGASVVFVDGQDSRGVKNRNAILSSGTDGRGIALQAEDFLQMTTDETREIARNHDVIYLYHNRIDAVGDKRDSEERVFEAVGDAFDDILKLVKKLTNANANNILITADHGFIYQNRELDESDFLSVGPGGKNIIDSDRRFVIGQGLDSQNSLKFFASEHVGLSGDVEIQIPKSINRLRKKGSGSRYVHGGTTLQEIIVPVIKVNKKRTSDVRRVDVNIIRGMNKVITSGQLTVKMYQEEPVNEKVQPRTLLVGLYTRDGKLISDTHEITFDLKSEADREREKSERLILSKEADSANGQSVYVRLLEREDGTSHDVEYDSVEYQLKRSFTSDFDF